MPGKIAPFTFLLVGLLLRYRIGTLSSTQNPGNDGIAGELIRNNDHTAIRFKISAGGKLNKISNVAVFNLRKLL